MLRECVFCGSALGQGPAIGFDPHKGRLWTICGACSRWNLAPMETRWEQLEQLERQTHDSGHLLTHTDHISLFTVGGVNIVRVGKAPLREEAWWRYGDTLRRRYRRARANRAAEVGIFLVLGIPLSVTAVQRWQMLGRWAWRGYRECARCGQDAQKISFRRANAMRIEQANRDLRLSLGCPQCGGSLDFTGEEARQILRRTLLHCNIKGAEEAVVHAALTKIEHAGSPSEYVRRVVSDQPTIGLFRNYDPVNAFALEISLNENDERAQLQASAQELEARWKEEEMLADIIDNELT